MLQNVWACQKKSPYLWVRLAKDNASPGSAETAQLKAEVSRLKADFKIANEERDNLKMAAAEFAKLSGGSTHLWPSTKANYA